MRQVRIVLTLTLVVVVAPASAQSGALNTYLYGLYPFKPSPLLSNFNPFVAGTYLLQLRTHTSPVGHAGALRFQDSSTSWRFERIGGPARSSDEHTSASNRSNTHDYSRWSLWLPQGRGGESK